MCIEGRILVNFNNWKGVGNFKVGSNGVKMTTGSRKYVGTCFAFYGNIETSFSFRKGNNMGLKKEPHVRNSKIPYNKMAIFSLLLFL